MDATSLAGTEELIMNRYDDVRQGYPGIANGYSSACLGCEPATYFPGPHLIAVWG